MQKGRIRNMLVHAILDIDGEEFASIDERVSPRLSYLTKPTPSSVQNRVDHEVEIVPYTLIDPHSIELLSQHVDEGDVILFKYPSDVDPEDAVLMKDILQAEFPEHKVLGVTKDIDLLVENADEAVAMLEKMIAHIKISSNRPKIVLD